MFIAHALCAPSPSSLAQAKAHAHSFHSLIWTWWIIETSLRWNWEGSVSPWQRQLLSVLWHKICGNREEGPLAWNQISMNNYAYTDTQISFWCLLGQLFLKRCTMCMQCGCKLDVNCKMKKSECRITPLPQNSSSCWAEQNKIITVTSQVLGAWRPRLFPQNNNQSHPLATL